MKRDARREILISDLSVCQPKSALANRYAPRKWKLLPYEHDEFSGVMLGAIGSRDAAPLTLPLNVKGWYEIYVGLYRTYEEIGVRLRLSSERAYRKFRVPVKWDFPKLLAVVEEHFWTAADLTGESIHIAPLAVSRSDIDNYVACFRLVPISAPKVRTLKKDRARKDTKRLIAMNDSTDIVARYLIHDKAGLAEEVDVYRNSDFRGVCFGLIKGDRPQWPIPGMKQRRFPQEAGIPIKIYEDLRRMWKKMDDSGFNYLRALRELTRSAGLELHVSHRMGHASQPPYEDLAPVDFHRGKYDDYCRLADGAPVQRFSYAKRHVQDHMLRIFEDAAGYGVEGLHLLFIRGGPAVLYEDEMVERFREEYGTRTDPRTLPLSDKRLLHVRGKIFGEYLQRLRATTRAAARKAGHRPPLISIHGLADRKACAVFGLDFASWAKQGLIDRIVASTWGTEFGRRNRPWPYVDIDYYADCVAGTRTQLWAEIPRPPEGDDCGDHYGRRAEFLYKNGVEGFYFWDTPWRHMHPEHFNVLSVLGHKRDLKARIAAARKKTREITLKKLIGVELAKHRFPPWLSG